MAVVKLTGDVRDAQRKIQGLRKEVDRLDKECKKPKKVKVDGTKTFKEVFKGAALGSFAGTLGGKLATTLQGIITQNLPAVFNLLGDMLGKQIKGSFLDIQLSWRKFKDLLPVYSNQTEEALKRGDSLDALDDQRRSHNSKDLAEQFAYTTAFNNVAGVQGGAIMDRIQSVLDMATSGNMSEMDKAWKMLSGFGVTWDDIQNKSTWAIAQQMFKAYHAAGADGSNELEFGMQQIVGRKGMAAVRKIGDGTEMGKQATEYMTEFRKRLPNPEKLLQVVGHSEFVRGLAALEQLVVPQNAHGYITKQADNQLATQKAITDMLSGQIGGWTILGQTLAPIADATDDIIGALTDKISSLPGEAAKWIIDVITGGLSQYFPKLPDLPDVGSVGDKLSGVTESAFKLVKQADPRQLLPKKNQGTPYPQGFIPVHEQKIGGGRIKATGIDGKKLKNTLEWLVPALKIFNNTLGSLNTNVEKINNNGIKLDTTALANNSDNVSTFV